MSSRLRTRFSNGRNGVTMIELVVSAVVMMAAMSFAVSMCFRINMVWKDIGHHRVAVAELSNQLEDLTRMTSEEASVALKNLSVSESCGLTLRDVKLVGELVKDNLGTRVKLSLDWKRPHSGNPVELCGWLNPEKKSPESENESNEEGRSEDSESASETFDEEDRT